MPASKACSRSVKAFTLIELSIVLVIIGLIVGGVLTGRELIASAQIRAQMSQLEKAHTAINTFRIRYNCLPGDCGNASQHGLFSTGMDGTVGKGNNNGILESHSAYSTDYTLPLGETMVFWRHLSDAKLTEGTYGASLVGGGAVHTYIDPAYVPAYLPEAKLGAGRFLYPLQRSGINYFEITLFGGMGIYPDGACNGGLSLTSAKLYALDRKMDDGLPLTGGVQAVKDDMTGDFAELSVPGDTCTAGSPAAYIPSSVTESTCNARFKFQ